MKGIQFCEITDGLGGPNLECSKLLYMNNKEIEEFIKLFAKQYDEYFGVYEFNDLGMKYIEKMGLCNQYKCPVKYFSIEDIKPHNQYSIKKFISGKFDNKHYKHIQDSIEVIYK